MEAVVLNEISTIPPYHTAMGTADSRRPTVLVADDAADTRLILTRTLEFENLECFQAADGKEALAKAIKHCPDLMLLDLVLPKMDGFQVLMRLKEENLPTKVCIVSAVEDEDFIQRAINIGASDYIVKPVIPDIILHKIHSLTEPLQSPTYFHLPCSLSGTVRSELKEYNCQICGLTEVGLTLRSDVYHPVGELLSLQSPSLERIAHRDNSFLVRVIEIRKSKKSNRLFDLRVEFVGLNENQRQRLRAEIIQGKFITDQTLLN